jgi:putative heme-binding domain-containing protein
LLQRAPQLALDASQSSSVRHAAIESLALLAYHDAAPALRALLSKPSPETLQLATIGTLEQFHEAAVGRDLVEHWRELTPVARARAFDAVLQRPERLAALWAAWENRGVTAADLSARQRDLLRKHRDPAVRERALRLLGPANRAAREDVYTALLPALQLAGSSGRGRTTFEGRCAGCHRLANVGLDFGPDLGAVRSGGKEKLLASIVDPNREVLPQFFVVTLETRDGETIVGMMRNETATTVTLRQPGGGERTVSRSDIASLKTSIQSLMPEGLEAGLSHQEIADLIEFLCEPGH